MSAGSALARLYPAALAVLLAAWLALLPSAAGRLRRRLGAARPRTGYWLGLILIAGLALRLTAGPAHQVYDDEFEHLDIAHHLAATGTFSETLVGGIAGYDVLGRPSWPGGHHVALAAIFKLFGGAERTAFVWSAVLSVLSALFVFWAALELFDDERGALAAAFVWAVLPLAVRYGRASDLTSSTLFWSAAALAALHAREREPGPRLDAFAACTVAFAVQVRPENVLLIGYAVLIRAPLAVYLPALLGAAVPGGIALANRAAALPGYSAASTAPLSHLARQFLPNLRYLASRAEFWPILLPAALAAFAKRPAARLAALSAAFLVLYGGFFRGRFDAGTEDRYALSALLPLSVAAAAMLPAAAVPAVLLAAGLSWGAPRPPEPEHEASRRFLAHSARLIPERAYVAAFNPSFVREVAGRPAAWAYLLLEDLPAFETARSRAGAAPELVLYKDWAWRSRPEEAARLEKSLTAGYEASPLADNGLDALVLLTPRPARKRVSGR
ncbi:MAG: glycosyltransferase family 39 protein [Elusimicrobia bacterium]|nr:glycosyltransferase family 39 protein [Elusimicrobiota bacterium]